MSLNSITEHAPGAGPSTARWMGATVAALIAWGIVYSQLVPFAEWVVALAPVDPKSHLGEALSFFAYDTPKVLMLLTLIVFGMGFVRSFFSPEKTRALLAGKREGVGNVLAALLGIVTPFCSCSAVPMFIGFVSAGVPLGVTFSFLISAPMVNEVALGLLFGLVGWKVALTYLVFGLAVAMVSGWVIGRLHLEHWLEEWVRNIRSGTAELPPENLLDRRPHQGGGRRCLRNRRQGLAVDHRRHRRRRLHPRLCASGPAGLDHGAGRLVVGAGRGAYRHSDVFECRWDHPCDHGAARKRCRTRDRARVHDVGDRAVTPRNDHPTQGPYDPADCCVHWCRRDRHPRGRFPVQRAVPMSQRRISMKDVKVLGPGCKRCVTTAEMVQTEADKLGVPVKVEKVTDYAAIASYGIVSTPGIVIDGKVVHAGGLPKPDDLVRWLAA